MSAPPGVPRREGKLHLARGLFPEGTEFLHSVRYIDVAEDGGVGMAARMKELRYARKLHWVSYADLEEAAMHEIKEGDDFPNRLRTIRGNAEIGVANGMGWVFQGFIEDRAGDLRPQTYEENVFCVGCHSGVGVTTDAVFSFPRRFAKGSFRDGWYHWSDKGFAGVEEPRRADGRYEFTHYLEQNGAGDEFRSNTEVIRQVLRCRGQPQTGHGGGPARRHLAPAAALGRTRAGAQQGLPGRSSASSPSCAAATPSCRRRRTCTRRSRRTSRPVSRPSSRRSEVEGPAPLSL